MAAGPGTEEARPGIEAWLRGELLREKYRYAPGPAEESPKHSHDEYQICLSLDFPGVYGYRGASHAVPVGNLSVIHPGEVHSARDPEERLTPSSFRMMHVETPKSARTFNTPAAGRVIFRGIVLGEGRAGWKTRGPPIKPPPIKTASGA